MPLQPAFVSELIPCTTYLAADDFQPADPSGRLDMYEQDPNIAQRSLPTRPPVNVPSAPSHSPEALIGDMWKSCPALCASIRHPFDVKVIFHPAIIALHGETFLRLAASQIAMQNQAAKMTYMRNALSQKQKLLDVDATSAKDLQTQLVAQQSELKEIRGLLEQNPRSHANSDATGNGKVRQSRSGESHMASQSGTISPLSPTSSSTSVDGPLYQFYERSAALPALKLSSRSENMDKYNENHGYGHAETHGPSFRIDRAQDHMSVNDMAQPSDQQSPLPPSVSTSTIFEPLPSPFGMIVSIGAKKQTFTVQDEGGDKENAKSTKPKEQTRVVEKAATSAPIKIMKREHNHESAVQKVNKKLETPKSELPLQVHDTILATPSKTELNSIVHEQRPTAVSNKPASYAAAVRTIPSMPSQDIRLTEKGSRTAPPSSPAPDLGFTLEPLPKPRVQQVQSQQQQVRPQPEQAPNTISDGENVPFDFHEWKQRKIANETWENRPNHTNMPHPHHRPFHPNYRGRGGRFNFHHHNHENSRPGPVNEEAQKREWLAWKQNLVSQGKWNPKHPFREAWKNE